MCIVPTHSDTLSYKHFLRKLSVAQFNIFCFVYWDKISLLQTTCQSVD